MTKSQELQSGCPYLCIFILEVIEMLLEEMGAMGK